MRRFLLLNINLITCILGFSQNEMVPMNNEFVYPFEGELYEKQVTNFHSGVKPFLKKDISLFVADSLLDQFGVLSFGSSGPDKMKGRKFISSLIEGTGLYQSGEDFQFTYGGGLYLSASGDKFGYTGFYRFGQFPRFQLQDSSLFMRESVNGLGLDQGNDLVHHFEFYLNYSPNEYFDLSIGNGKHFWGDGYRSFFVSDNASPYPFFRINSSFWNVRYTNLYAMHVDNHFSGFRRKFVSSHQLSWNIIRNLNLTIYETVIFAQKDTLGQRNFDVHYINPIIFLRPVEYSIGSSDNVLLGASLRYTLYDKYTFYSQLVLDEFLLSAYRENNGWWANKFGAQIGFKTFDLLNIKGLSYQIEYNFSRPFTFAHKSSVLNYGHLGQSLAHPVGANFYELNQIVRYQMDKWYFRIQVQYQDRGEDYNEISFGGDIYQPYINRDRDYGHNIGQGEGHYIWWNQISASYNILPKFNLRAFVDYTLRSDRSNGTTHIDHLVQVGIRTSLWNTYNDY